MKLTSTALQQGETIPKHYTADGTNVSPPLRWTEPPAATQSLALVCTDPDAPRGTWTHWVLYNLPATARDLPEAVPTTGELADGVRQGRNDFGKLGYGGPAPPRGKPHRYVFTVYALDAASDLGEGATRQQLEAAMKGHILATGQLTGTYQR
jgi:Raf kinase inhibitor-like YbhB/YbcL family protein